MSRLTNPAYICPLLEKNGFHFSRSMGQNFLIDASVPERIAESVQADENCSVLEIGPGIGCLTEELSQRAGQVITVELDRRLSPVLEETLSGRDNVDVLYADVMKLNLREVAEQKMRFPVKLVCASLPYNITSPVLTALIQAGCFERICVMIQKEVAQRICAGPGTKDYGAFGLFVQWHCETELLFTVPPHCFLPAPKVTSAVILLKRRETPPAETEDEDLMLRVIRAAFGQRRKTLVNALAAGIPGLGKNECEKILAGLNLETNIRGEMLKLGDFARISNEIKAVQEANL